jgi:hypothetical protein
MITRLVVASLRRLHARGASRRVLRLAVACMATLGLLAVGAGAASAAEEHKNFCKEATPPEICTGAGSTNGYSEPFGVAVDNATTGEGAGDVYVVSLGGTVTRYTSAGAPAPFTGTNLNISGNQLTGFSTSVGVGVDSSTGSFYVTSRAGSGNVIEEFNSEGNSVASFPLPGFEEDTGVAVDNSSGSSNGDIYVADGKNNVIDKLEPGTGTVLLQIKGTVEHPLEEPYGVAVDGSGNVYVESNRSGNVLEFNESGVFQSVLNENGAHAVAIDPSTGNIYVVDAGGTEVQPYTSAGAPLTPFGAGELEGTSDGAGVGRNHFVYVGERNNHVQVLGSSSKALEVITGPSENVTTTSATITGTVKPVEAPEATEIEFEWGPAGKVEEHKVPASETSATGEVHVHAELSGLQAETKYVYRLSAKAGGETIQGAQTPLTTLSLATVTTEPASEVKIEGATLNGKLVVSPGVEEKGEYYFEYTPEGGSATKTTATPFTGNEVTPSVPVSSLEPGKKYHALLVAVVEGHEIKGTPEVEFETPALARVKTEPPSEVKAESATLNGELNLNPEVAEGEYYFEYGEEGSSPQTKTALKPFTSSGKVNETVPLEPGKKYEYRLVAVVKGQNIEAGVEKFEALGLAPSVTSKPPLSVTRTAASLSGEVNTENSPAEYFIEYGETEAYGSPGSPTSVVSLPAATGPATIAPVTLEELRAGTTYHYRIVAKNATGTTDGPDGTFKTSAPQIPTAVTGAAAGITQTSATITAEVDPDGLQTTYIFEVGTEVEGNLVYTPTYGEAGSGFEGVGLSLPLSNLLPGTTYHYRIVAINEDGTVEGADRTFTTPGFPSPITEPVHPLLIPFTPPKEEVKKPAPKSETRAQKYAKAVKQCKKAKNKKKRAACMKRAKRQYGPPAKKKKTKK